MHKLSASTVQTLHAIFKQFPQIQRVLLFGSRARGDARDNSDIDLAVEGDLSASDLANVKWALEKSPLLYKIDLVDATKNTDAKLRQVIEREGKVFYP